MESLFFSRFCVFTNCIVSYVLQTRNFFLQKEEAMELVRQAILAGVFNDLYSGTGVDLCVITNTGTDFLPHFDIANERGVR